MTGSAKGEAVWELISWLAALACRAIRPSFLLAANVMSCTDWPDKALQGGNQFVLGQQTARKLHKDARDWVQLNHPSGQRFAFSRHPAQRNIVLCMFVLV